MQKPKYCPNCGRKFTDDSLVKAFTELVFYHRTEKEKTVPANGWGVECHDCGWAGEISPDV